MRQPSLITACVVMAIAAVSGRAAAPQTTVRNTATCDSLTGLAIPAASIGLPTTGATIAAADLIAAAPQTIVADRALLAIPEYCKVTGSIAPVDPSAPKINFQVNLPASWNRK